jgi:hypothetical protein
VITGVNYRESRAFRKFRFSFAASGFTILRLPIEPVNDSQFYCAAKVSFLPTKPHNGCESESSLSIV